MDKSGAKSATEVKPPTSDAEVKISLWLVGTPVPQRTTTQSVLTHGDDPIAYRGPQPTCGRAYSPRRRSGPAYAGSSPSGLTET